MSDQFGWWWKQAQREIAAALRALAQKDQDNG
jgi:hypothetical protein